jgi:hypothetical protein
LEKLLHVAFRMSTRLVGLSGMHAPYFRNSKRTESVPGDTKLSR